MVSSIVCGTRDAAGPARGNAEFGIDRDRASDSGHERRLTPGLWARPGPELFIEPVQGFDLVLRGRDVRGSGGVYLLAAI